MFSLRRAVGISVAAAALAVALSPTARPQSVSAVASDYETLHQVNAQIATPVQAHSTCEAGWWQSLVALPIRPENESTKLSLEATLIRALEYSNQIKVFSDLPLIRETAIIEADAAFDWTRFMEARWDDTTEPIGNSLTAGGNVEFFEDHQVNSRAGLRRRTLSGANVEVFQRLGFQDNNSTFFVPDPQGTARLNLAFTQPLLRGHGKQYNQSLVLLARIDKNVADDELERQLQSHLLEVTRSYWALYLERAVLYQKINSYVRGKEVFDRLNSRREIDAQPTQILSAEATMKTRVSELVRARAAVQNAESRLRSLVNDPTLCVEVIPTDMPSFENVPVDICESVSVAFQMRPEMRQAVKNIKAASVRLRMAKHEMLPVLNLVTQFFLSGLEDDGQVFEAWGNQFSVGKPSYGFGLEYELPVGNRAASARQRRRILELRQLSNQYATTLESVRLEVEVAVRELQTSQNELSTKQQAMNARAAQLVALTQRWEKIPGEDVSAVLALENLLAAQEQLARSEFEYLQSQLTFKLSTMNLKRATGTLLQSEQVDIGRACVCNTPQNIITKTTSPENDPAIFYQQVTPVEPLPPVHVKVPPMDTLRAN
ncbi:MAG: TolC family protein [Planctomycetota bacterium]